MPWRVIVSCSTSFTLLIFVWMSNSPWVRAQTPMPAYGHPWIYTAGGRRTTPFNGSVDLNQMESNMEKQPELYMHCVPCNHCIHCSNRRDLDKYATRLINGSSAKEAFVSSFSSEDLNVAIYIRNRYNASTETRQILRPWLRLCFIFTYTPVWYMIWILKFQLWDFF